MREIVAEKMSKDEEKLKSLTKIAKVDQNRERDEFLPFKSKYIKVKPKNVDINLQNEKSNDKVKNDNESSSSSDGPTIGRIRNEF